MEIKWSLRDLSFLSEAARRVLVSHFLDRPSEQHIKEFSNWLGSRIKFDPNNFVLKIQLKKAEKDWYQCFNDRQERKEKLKGALKEAMEMTSAALLITCGEAGSDPIKSMITFLYTCRVEVLSSSDRPLKGEDKLFLEFNLQPSAKFLCNCYYSNSLECAIPSILTGLTWVAPDQRMEFISKLYEQLTNTQQFSISYQILNDKRWRGKESPFFHLFEEISTVIYQGLMQIESALLQSPGVKNFKIELNNFELLVCLDNVLKKDCNQYLLQYNTDILNPALLILVFGIYYKNKISTVRTDFMNGKHTITAMAAESDSLKGMAKPEIVDQQSCWSTLQGEQLDRLCKDSLIFYHVSLDSYRHIIAMHRASRAGNPGKCEVFRACGFEVITHFPETQTVLFAVKQAKIADLRNLQQNIREVETEVNKQGGDPGLNGSVAPVFARYLDQWSRLRDICNSKIKELMPKWSGFPAVHYRPSVLAAFKRFVQVHPKLLKLRFSNPYARVEEEFPASAEEFTIRHLILLARGVEPENTTGVIRDDFYNNVLSISDIAYLRLLIYGTTISTPIAQLSDDEPENAQAKPKKPDSHIIEVLCDQPRFELPNVNYANIGLLFCYPVEGANFFPACSFSWDQIEQAYYDLYQTCRPSACSEGSFTGDEDLIKAKHKLEIKRFDDRTKEYVVVFHFDLNAYADAVKHEFLFAMESNAYQSQFLDKDKFAFMLQFSAALTAHFISGINRDEDEKEELESARLIGIRRALLWLKELRTLDRQRYWGNLRYISFIFSDYQKKYHHHQINNIKELVLQLSLRFHMPDNEVKLFFSGHIENPSKKKIVSFTNNPGNPHILYGGEGSGEAGAASVNAKTAIPLFAQLYLQVAIHPDCEFKESCLLPIQAENLFELTWLGKLSKFFRDLLQRVSSTKGACAWFSINKSHYLSPGVILKINKTGCFTISFSEGEQEECSMVYLPEQDRLLFNHGVSKLRTLHDKRTLHNKMCRALRQFENCAPEHVTFPFEEPRLAQPSRGGGFTHRGVGAAACDSTVNLNPY